ncbi:hypothetical protein PRIPAC_96993 [Pristionchus pacificus]|uniref:Uncharacterized protein n=1 Tax=Pristionchus pacificus TaxID=54126 RepID=A0A2A6BBZ2_PRIPA|nr:hypothetical protein PRIPAC_96993 [Pristionchus pacificus]|eukprot:PDM63361.1 hypothetical protein PRIPAC_53718 [Pristionchus pacificus]
MGNVLYRFLQPQDQQTLKRWRKDYENSVKEFEKALHNGKILSDLPEDQRKRKSAISRFFLKYHFEQEEVFADLEASLVRSPNVRRHMKARAIRAAIAYAKKQWGLFIEMFESLDVENLKHTIQREYSDLINIYQFVRNLYAQQLGQLEFAIRRFDRLEADQVKASLRRLKVNR